MCSWWRKRNADTSASSVQVADLADLKEFYAGEVSLVEEAIE